MDKRFSYLVVNPELISFKWFRCSNPGDIAHRFISLMKESVVIEISNDQKQQMITRLAGTTKISKVASESNTDSIDKMITQYDWGFEGKQKRKLKFSLDVLNYSARNEEELRKFRSWLKGIVKRTASLKSIKAEYEDLSLSDLYREHRTKKQDSHLHIVFHMDNKTNTVYLCSEHIFSNPMDLKKRTDDRPVKDFSIMSSLRFARMLVNISGTKPGETILDPFCGIGTILGEAMAIGCNGIGVEIEKSRVSDARQNLKWYKEKYYPDLPLSFKIFEGDSTRLSQVIDKKQFAEKNNVGNGTRFGTALRGTPTDAEVKHSKSILDPLYNSFFGELFEMLPDNAKIVIILPEFITKEGKSYKLKIDNLRNFQTVNPTKGLDMELSMPIECSEDWNYISRKLYILQKKA